MCVYVYLVCFKSKREFINIAAYRTIPFKNSLQKLNQSK